MGMIGPPLSREDAHPPSVRHCLRVRAVPAAKASFVVSVGRFSRLIVWGVDDGLARKVCMNGSAAPTDGAERGHGQEQMLPGGAGRRFYHGVRYAPAVA